MEIRIYKRPGKKMLVSCKRTRSTEKRPTGPVLVSEDKVGDEIIKRVREMRGEAPS